MSAAHLRPLALRSAAVALVAALGAAMTGATAASAATTLVGHDPVGAVEAVSVTQGQLRISGWAADPDALRTNVVVSATVDGRGAASSTVTSIARPTIAAARHTGATPGYALTLPAPTGHHIVCVLARNVGYGLTGLLRCFATPVGTRLSGAQQALRSPYGSFTHDYRHAHSVHVEGWTTDPDMIGRHSVVVAYVDGIAAATFLTQPMTGTRPAGAGPYATFDRWLPVSSGSHLTCIWVVNVGLGHNTDLGCKATDTRGPAGSGTIRVPTLNTKVVAEAKKHIGQRYVWGARGPKTFDCSGLVAYSYAKNGFTTPRVAADQFAAARHIPAGRAVAGDLVFYSSSTGHVYHVGIVTGPDMSVAAIDPAEGVDWQRIWPSTLTVYGSFTHI